MVLDKIYRLDESRNPLKPMEIHLPAPSVGEIRVKVSACGVCHTELDEIEGRTPPPAFPVIPGHQIVGRVDQMGPDSKRFQPGDRVGIAWIHSACGNCEACRQENENLCDSFRATGRDVHGGYAEFAVVREDFAYPIPDTFSDIEAAPLLCAGAIGYRSLRLTGLVDAQPLGLTGFGASAHLVLRMVRLRFPNSRVYVFARSANERRFAKELGAVWAGGTEDVPPEKLQAVIDTTPAWKPVLEALRHLKSGGRLVINAIRKEDRDKDRLLDLDYPVHLWREKEIKSVANVSRKDVEEFLHLAALIPIKPHVQTFPLEEANAALMELKEGKIRGAKVLEIAG